MILRSGKPSRNITKETSKSRWRFSSALPNFPVPDFVWDEYHIDQEINDRGVRLDMDLVEKPSRWTPAPGQN
jgi:hypothetical protein